MDARNYFESNQGVKFPQDTNPADVFLDMLVENDESRNQQLAQASGNPALLHRL